MEGSLSAAFFSGVESCPAGYLPIIASLSKIIQVAKINSSTVPALKMKQLQAK